MIAGNQGQNVYPSPENYPVSSFPQEVPAPDVDPDDAGTLITVQYSWEWQQVLLAAIDQLRNYATWQGDHDAKILAQDRATWLKSMLQAQVTVTSDVEAPYWDDDNGDDADDTASPAMQPWYGQLQLVDDNLTFVENIGFWLIVGFVAYAATPLAAIAFIPIARRFTLAFKKHDLGGIVKAFIDGNEIASMDTYSPTSAVGEMQIIIPETMAFLAEDAPPVLWVEMSDDVNPAVTGEPNIQVIRKRLSPDDLYPPDTRYDDTTDTIQTTVDGGATWQDAATLDPRSNPAYAKPLLGAGHSCDAAANMVKWLHDFIDYELGLFTAGAVITGFASSVLLFVDLLFPAAIFASLLIDIAGIIFDTGSTALAAAFDSTTYDDLLCIFHCNVGDDGSVSEAQFAHIQAEVTATLNTTAGIIVGAILGAQGNIGLQNAGAIGSEAGDCSGCATCAWVKEWDFTGGSLQGWEIYYGAPYIYGAFSGGEVDANKQASPNLSLFLLLRQAGIHVTGFSFFGTQFHGNNIGSRIYFRNITGTGSSPAFSEVSNTGLDTVTTDAWVAPAMTAFTTTNGFALTWLCDNNGTGYVHCKKIRLQGTGPAPAGGVFVSSLT